MSEIQDLIEFHRQKLTVELEGKREVNAERKKALTALVNGEFQPFYDRVRDAFPGLLEYLESRQSLNETARGLQGFDHGVKAAKAQLAREDTALRDERRVKEALANAAEAQRRAAKLRVMLETTMQELEIARAELEIARARALTPTPPPMRGRTISPVPTTVRPARKPPTGDAYGTSHRVAPPKFTTAEETEIQDLARRIETFIKNGKPYAKATVREVLGLTGNLKPVWDYLEQQRKIRMEGRKIRWIGRS